MRSVRQFEMKVAEFKILDIYIFLIELDYINN